MKRQRRLQKDQETWFAGILAQLQRWEQGAVLAVRPERTDAVDDQKTKKLKDVNGGGVKYQVAGVAHVVDLLVLWIVLLKFDEGVANLDMVVLI